LSFFDKNIPQPIHILKRTGSQDNPHLDIEENISMTVNRIILKEIPVQYYGLLVSSSSGEYFNEVKSLDKLNETTYHVDYTYGVVTFSDSVIGKTLDFTYKGEGFILLSADRIFIHDEQGFAVETLQELIDLCKTSTEEYTQLITYKVQQLNQKLVQADSAINNANNAASQTRQATADYQAVTDKTKKIYKPMVNTYADILSTYPNPENGWTVTEKQYGLTYRWDETEWVNIAASEVYEGFNVHIGEYPPDNINMLWVKVTGVTGYKARVVASETPPQGNSIWWKID